MNPFRWVRSILEDAGRWRAFAKLLTPSDLELGLFLADVRKEAERARGLFPGDTLRTLAFAEEAGEVVKAVLDESPERVRKEAVQVAAMAARIVLDGDGSVVQWRADKGLAQLGKTPGRIDQTSEPPSPTFEGRLTAMVKNDEIDEVCGHLLKLCETHRFNLTSVPASEVHATAYRCLQIFGREPKPPASLCIWPDCGHDTNCTGYSAGCTGEFCPKRAPT